MRRLLVISLLALAAAGCGGGGGDPLTKEEFTRQGNEICQELDRKVEDLGAPESLEAVEEFTGRAADIARNGRDELAKLEPPDDLQEDYDRLLGMLDEEIEDIERLGEAAAGGDQTKVQTIIAEGSAKSEASDQLAQELGLDDCAQD